MSKVAVLGSGDVGKTLAKGFEKHGYEVKQVSRGEFASASKWADIVVLAVKGTVAEAALETAGAENIAGKPVLDTTNPISDEKPENGVIRYFTGPNDSLMERLQKKFPDAKLVKVFSCVGNAFMVNPDFGGAKPTMFICGNDAGAKETTRAILDKFGWETEDMGSVTSARAIEPLCILWCARGFIGNGWTHAFKLLKK